jgi:CRP/FNR family transcriptional regulator, dissimilatory nitrate respiration regulator
MYEKISLFYGIKQENIPSMMGCISGYHKSYKKNEFIILAGDKIETVGIVLSGSVIVTKENYNGDRKIILTASENDIFVESLVAAGINISPVNVIAKQDCKILFIPMAKLLSSCTHACSFHTQLIFNFVKVLAKKNIDMDQKLDYVSTKTTRQRIAKYLMNQVDALGKMTVVLPLNKNELAEYLNVDRSVLSRELSKMKKEGIIDFDKNTFHILDIQILSNLSL